MAGIRLSALALFAVLSGCGSNRPTIPEELLHEEGGTGPANYPEGPYCSNPGDCIEGATVGNFTFAKG